MSTVRFDTFAFNTTLREGGLNTGIAGQQGAPAHHSGAGGGGD